MQPLNLGQNVGLTFFLHVLALKLQAKALIESRSPFISRSRHAVLPPQADNLADMAAADCTGHHSAEDTAAVNPSGSVLPAANNDAAEEMTLSELGITAVKRRAEELGIKRNPQADPTAGAPHFPTERAGDSAMSMDSMDSTGGGRGLIKTVGPDSIRGRYVTAGEEGFLPQNLTEDDPPTLDPDAESETKEPPAAQCPPGPPREPHPLNCRGPTDGCHCTTCRCVAWCVERSSTVGVEIEQDQDQDGCHCATCRCVAWYVEHPSTVGVETKQDQDQDRDQEPATTNGSIFNPSTEAEVTPALTGERLPIQAPPAGARFDPFTGKSLAVQRFDPFTGKPLAAQQGPIVAAGPGPSSSLTVGPVSTTAPMAVQPVQPTLADPTLTSTFTFEVEANSQPPAGPEPELDLEPTAPPQRERVVYNDPDLDLAPQPAAMSTAVKIKRQKRAPLCDLESNPFTSRYGSAPPTPSVSDLSTEAEVTPAVTSSLAVGAVSTTAPMAVHAQGFQQTRLAADNRTLKRKVPTTPVKTPTNTPDGLRTPALDETPTLRSCEVSLRSPPSTVISLQRPPFSVVSTVVKIKRQKRAPLWDRGSNPFTSPGGSAPPTPSDLRKRAAKPASNLSKCSGVSELHPVDVSNVSALGAATAVASAKFKVGLLSQPFKVTGVSTTRSQGSQTGLVMRVFQPQQHGHSGFCFISSAYHGRNLWARLPSEGRTLCKGDHVNFDSRLSNRPPFCGEAYAYNVTRTAGVGTCTSGSAYNVTRTAGVGNRTARSAFNRLRPVQRLLGPAFSRHQPSSHSRNPTEPSAGNDKPGTSLANSLMVVTSTKASFPAAVSTPAGWPRLDLRKKTVSQPSLTSAAPVADGCVTETTRITCKHHTDSSFETVVGVINDVCRTCSEVRNARSSEQATRRSWLAEVNCRHPHAINCHAHQSSCITCGLRTSTTIHLSHRYRLWHAARICTHKTARNESAFSAEGKCSKCDYTDLSIGLERREAALRTALVATVTPNTRQTVSARIAKPANQVFGPSKVGICGYCGEPYCGLRLGVSLFYPHSPHHTRLLA